MDYPALLSVVSQLLSVCNPADSLVRLQRGATPVAACLQAPAKLCRTVAAVQHCSETVLVFPSCQNIIVLVGGVVLPPPHAASGTDCLARRPSCKACKSPPCCPRLKRIPYVTRPTSCSHPGISACRANDTPTIERIINAFVPRKALRRPHADFGAGQRQVSPPL